MFSFRIDKRTFRMKLHYFLYLGGIASFQGFSPTMAKQLGYSPMVVGSIYTYLSILAFLVKPLCGYIVDKVPVKKILFLTCVMGCGLSAFSFNFIQKLPSETVVHFSCDKTTTTLDICLKDEVATSKCPDSNLSKMLRNSAESIECKLICQQHAWFWDEMCNSWNISDYCTTPNKTFNSDDNIFINVSLFVDTMHQEEINSIYQVKSVKIKENNISLPVCKRPVITHCEMKCSNVLLMAMATVTKFEGSIFGLYQFWSLVMILSFFWISQAITWNLQDPICFDILGDKPGDFGKQRCWGSISWGLCTIFGGVLVDHFSDNSFQKNYVPIFYLCLIIIICDFVVAYNIEVTETTGSKNTFSDVLQLLTQFKVIVYFIWIIIMGICSSMPWNFLFWYMEDITLKYKSDVQSQIKTLQGLAIGVQCIGGELPFLFFSGWIIKRVGHWYCMSLGLFAFALRFYMYSIVTNPYWILPVELADGVAFGLCHAVLIAYARIVAPSSGVTTVIGLSGALYEGVGSSIGAFLGGCLYEKYGGEWTFRLFSYGALSMAILLILFIKIKKPNAPQHTNHELEVTKN